MKKEMEQPHAYKPIMAGLFTGIIATVLNIFYDVFYRGATGFSLPELINVSSIIFGTLLILVLAGVVFAVLDKFIKPVSITYIILFVALTLFCVYLSLHVNRSADPVLMHQFRGLLLGIVLISGVLASFLVPYLATHETMFI